MSTRALDIPDEIEAEASPDVLPKTIEVIWDDDKIEKVSTDPKPQDHLYLLIKESKTSP